MFTAAPQSRVGSPGLGVAILPVWSRWNRLPRQVVKVSFSGDIQKPSGHSCPWSATRLLCLLANESTCSVARYVWLLPLSCPDSELRALVRLAFLLLNPLFIQLWWHSLQRGSPEHRTSLLFFQVLLTELAVVFEAVDVIRSSSDTEILTALCSLCSDTVSRGFSLQFQWLMGTTACFSMTQTRLGLLTEVEVNLWYSGGWCYYPYLMYSIL